MDRIEVLESEIKKYDKLYWEKGISAISDIDYDRIILELKGLSPNSELINKINSPKVFSSGKIRHLHKMLSLEKETSISNIIEWCKKKSRSPKEIFIFEPKYDGCSIEIFNNMMATRGDGIIGEDITEKFSICQIECKGELIDPLNIDYVRGEILFKKKDFEIYNKKMNGKYKTPRNACGGILNRDDNENTGKVLTIVPFDEYQTVVGLDEITKEKINEYMTEVLSSDYPCDGIVIKIADPNYRESLGSSSTYNKWEISLKFSNPTGESILKSIEWCVGKHRITPRAHIDPVEIGGVIVSHINLHNYKYLIDNDICIGDTLTVERAGDVIPDFKSLKPGENRISPNIYKCPECDSDVVYKEPDLVCTSENCSGEHIMKLMDSITRIGIERLGKPTLEKLINELDVKDLIDVFNLRKEDILKLSGFADVSANNLISEISKAKENITEWKILSSLNIKGIGIRLSQELLSGRNLKQLFSMSIDDFTSINGMGKKRADLLVESLSEMSSYVDGLMKIIIPITGIPLESNIIDSNENMKSICFTGKMPEKRSVYEKMAIENGYKIGSANKNLDILVCIDINGNSSKLKNAKKFGTEIINIDDFLNLIK